MNKDHPKVKFGKTGILIINLGTPDSTSWWDIRKYLKEFLSDRRVIEVNPIIWQIILNLFILTFRPSKTAHAYKQIWRKESNESPLLYFTKSQAAKLRNKVASEKIIVDYAMRYGNPSIKSRLNSLKENGCENIIISLQIIPHYESEPLYIDALVNSIEKKIKEISWKPDLIISSYHGIPKSYFDKGDPYHCYCHKTTRLIKEKFNKIEIRTTFQSRFGPQEWLTPYTDKTLESLPEKGIKNLLVICPGFASDCVETLEEINIQGRESFIEKGGENFDLIPCLNDNSDHIQLFEKLIDKYL